jgi:hypothetical protein
MRRLRATHCSKSSRQQTRYSYSIPSPFQHPRQGGRLKRWCRGPIPIGQRRGYLVKRRFLTRASSGREGVVLKRRFLNLPPASPGLEGVVLKRRCLLPTPASPRREGDSPKHPFLNPIPASPGREAVVLQRRSLIQAGLEREGVVCQHRPPVTPGWEGVALKCPATVVRPSGVATPVLICLRRRKGRIQTC